MLTIGIPLVGDLPQECVTDLCVAVAQVAKVQDRITFVCPQSVMPHDRARELIMREALKMDSDLLWFIDADTRPPEGAFNKLLKVLREKNAAMVSGYYVQRGYPFVSTWSKIKGECEDEGLTVIEETDTVVEIDGCGLGCALIDLKWIKDNLLPPYFLMHPDPSLSTMYRWEDAYFCSYITKQGGKIFGCTDVVSTHMGRRGELTPESGVQLKAAIDKRRALNKEGEK